MNEWPLLIFTLLMQLSIGCVVMAWFYQQFACFDLKRDELPHIVRPAIMMAFFFGMIGLGASFVHLGNPFNAFYTVSHFSSSWMSREIVFTALFMALLLLSIITILVRGYVSFGLVAMTAIVGLIDLYVMAAIYDNSIYILWQGWQTYTAFYGSSLLMGSVLSALFMLPKLNEYGTGNESLAHTLFNMVLVGLSLVTISTMAMFYIASPDFALSDTLNARTLPDGLLTLTIIRYSLVLIGMFVIGKVLAKPQSKAISFNLFVALICMTAGEGFGRYVFFSVGG
jgi:anaerobic dimethyl sulfoxide reductase subunit C (anchor subunit)